MATAYEGLDYIELFSRDGFAHRGGDIHVGLQGAERREVDFREDEDLRAKGDWGAVLGDGCEVDRE